MKKTPRDLWLNRAAQRLPARVQIRALAVMHYGGSLASMAEDLGVSPALLSTYPHDRAGGKLGAKIEAQTGVPRS